MARISAFSREIDLIVSRHLSPEARQQHVGKAARKILKEAQATNRRVLGVVPPHKQFVDGREGAPLESVNADHGHIVFQFELIGEALRWVGEQLVIHSPVGTPPEDPHPGLYQQSHVLLADGVEVEPEAGMNIPPAEEYKFVSLVPYARKIERGQSDQAPDGVYEVVAAMAQRRFGNIAKFRFTHTEIAGGAKGGMLFAWAERNAAKVSGSAAKRRQQFIKNVRQPSIVVRPR